MSGEVTRLVVALAEASARAGAAEKACAIVDHAVVAIGGVVDDHAICAGLVHDHGSATRSLSGVGAAGFDVGAWPCRAIGGIKGWQD